MTADKPSLATLRGALSQLPDAEYQDIKGIWETGEKLTGGSTNNAGGQPDPVRRRHPALWWHFRSPERLSVAVSVLFRLIEAGKATAVVPAIVVAEFYYLSAKSGRLLGASALLVTGDFEMRKSNKMELTHRVVVASSADSARRRTRCSGGSVPGAAN